MIAKLPASANAEPSPKTPYVVVLQGDVLMKGR